MPDPTNPNTPATTASNPMASAPSWEQFVTQYYRPVAQSPFIRRQQRDPTLLDPFTNTASPFGGILNFQPRDPNAGWMSLFGSGLLGQYGIEDRGQWMEAQRRQRGVDILQQVFRDWQFQQMQQQQQGQPQQQPTEAQAVQPNPEPQTPANQIRTPAQIIAAFQQSAASTPQPLGSYASLLAAMNAVPQQAAQQQMDPLASWIMQYLRG